MGDQEGRRTTHVDRAIGQRIRAERWAAKVSQTMLSEMVGVKFQQVQKYETGENRIAASRLMLVADALNVPLMAFLPDSDAELEREPMSHHAVQLAAAFDRLNLSQQNMVRQVVKVLEE